MSPDILIILIPVGIIWWVWHRYTQAKRRASRQFLDGMFAEQMARDMAKHAGMPLPQARAFTNNILDKGTITRLYDEQGVDIGPAPREEQ